AEISHNKGKRQRQKSHRKVADADEARSPKKPTPTKPEENLFAAHTVGKPIGHGRPKPTKAELRRPAKKHPKSVEPTHKR
ncbi:Hypothetical predicted protein, partial [Olea europaea subsp. europaea]